MLLTKRSAARAAAIGIASALSALSPTRARAFCRELTARPPAGYDPVTAGCFDAGAAAKTLYWRNLCVGYSLQKDGSAQVSLADASRVAAAAFAAWSAASCGGAGAPSIRAVAQDPVDCAEVRYDPSGPNQHVIVFRDERWPYDDASNALGLTTLTFDAESGEIYDADIEINAHDFSLVAEGSAPFGAFDLATVLTHEAGHFLGIAHSDDASAVMSAHYRAGSASLGADDIAGVCALYSLDGSRSTSAGRVPADACDPTPRHGFTRACAAANDGGESAAPPAPATSRSPSRSCAFAASPSAADAIAAPSVFGAAALTLCRWRRRRTARFR